MPGNDVPSDDPIVRAISDVYDQWLEQGDVSRPWPPPEYRLRAALSRGAGHLARGEFFAALRAFADASHAADGEEREFSRGLFHLAAAGYKLKRGDERGYARQLAHARRRLEPFVPRHRDLEVAELLEQVAQG